MCSNGENTESINCTIRNISRNQQQAVISFRPIYSCTEEEIQSSYKKIAGKILDRRDVIIVTKQDQLKDIISDAVNTSDQDYVTHNAIEVISFTPQPESNVKHHATLLKKMPIGVAEDLATSSEFIYGNLWFLIANDENTTRCKEDVIDDVRKLTPSKFRDLPILQHETVALPAMYDGLEILWFKPNEDILSKQFAYKK